MEMSFLLKKFSTLVTEKKKKKKNPVADTLFFKF
jgi:hypothetical protein